ncbi:MAG TPA: cytochrome c [Bryobacteraceae bacterium]|nr:cytochrome c [Bryobacteraceae bacterium]
MLAAAFAVILNSSDPTPADDRKPVADAMREQAADAIVAADAKAWAGTGPAAQLVERGQAVFSQHDCARCHSVAGKGSPRSPLDGVGTRLARDELYGWVVAGDAAQAQLSPRAIAAKQRHVGMSDADMDAHPAYLAWLRD